MKTNHLYTLLFFLCVSSLCQAKVKLPVLISDGMVLQRDQPVKVWGYGDPGEEINIRFLKKKYKTNADTNGNWEIILPAIRAGGPYVMSINELEVKDIWMGDVWLCSGQSNMETPLSRVTDLFAEEIFSDSNRMIRHIKVPLSYNFREPRQDIKPAEWKPATQQHILSITAVPYFFAKYLYEDIKVPIGLINSSVGGSPAEAWISEEGLKDFPHYLHDKKMCESDGYIEEALQLQHRRNFLWNTVLHRTDEGLLRQWHASSAEENEWKSTDMFSSWGSDGVNPINGSFWFKKEIEVPETEAGQKATLRLGCIVDADSVFVNGTFVGTTSYQYPPRIYPIPANLLKAGKNDITIRLLSYGGFPHFVKDKPYKLVFDQREIDLGGEWKYRIGTRMPAMPGGISFQNKPTGLYNDMIAPLQHVTFKGVLWYQGESNTNRYNEYYSLLSALINDWRTYWKREDLPFLLVQLPNFMESRPYPSESGWAGLRDAQLKISQTVPNTGLAVTIDLGEWNDIHPLNKKDVGYRLFLQAKRLIYGDKSVIADGPVYESMQPDGNKIILSFKEGTNDLMPVKELKGFAVAGEDGKYRWAESRIEGKTVIIWNDAVSHPVKIRYAWENNPEEANLRNKNGLPASPFEIKTNK